MDDLISDEDSGISALGSMLLVYQGLLLEENLIDFSSIQTECYRLLMENPPILDELQNQIRYLMIDEYQDTNYIQEQIIFMLGKKHQNICVVGDDDQGLYRFRGATIRNILEFPDKFADGECVVIPLMTNYRSNSNIVQFYNEWMTTTIGQNFWFHWDKFRYEKQIEPHVMTTMKSPAVVKLSGQNSENDWREQILAFINDLKHSGKLTDYNQLAFLFSSVKNSRVTGLANFLERSGINVYSPRSDMFFERPEIKLVIGCLMLMFPNYIAGLTRYEYAFLNLEHCQYYFDCLDLTNEFVKHPENEGILNFISAHRESHAKLQGATDYAYSGLLYQLIEFRPFRDMLDVDLNLGVVDVRPTRNLALFTQIIVKFEYLHRIDVLDGKIYQGKRRIDTNTETLFNLYLRLLFDDGITEYEDDSEYAPSGCVSFMTIHQAKGMEFPIVFVDSLGNAPRKSYKDIMVEIEKRYFHRPPYEPYDEMKYYDFWRLYYTAFSRAQDLLILTCNENKRTPSKYFAEIYENLQTVNDSAFDLQEFDFHGVKKVNLKDTFSFTSHISVYEACALQYKFFRELDFMPVQQGGFLFGSLVHETIEDIHRSVLRGEESLITEENITKWFENNYASLTKSEHMYLADPQRTIALKQVLMYAERQTGRWDLINQAKVDVTVIRPDYVLDGKVDLIKGEGDTVELIDFKTERKPDMKQQHDRLELYRRQLELYAYLVEQRTGRRVSRMNIYYTSEVDGDPIISFPYTENSVTETVSALDGTVHKILRKEYSHCADNLETCKSCDFRFYCRVKW